MMNNSDFMATGPRDQESQVKPEEQAKTPDRPGQHQEERTPATETDKEKDKNNKNLKTETISNSRPVVQAAISRKAAPKRMTMKKMMTASEKTIANAMTTQYAKEIPPPNNPEMIFHLRQTTLTKPILKTRLKTEKLIP